MRPVLLFVLASLVACGPAAAPAPAPTASAPSGTPAPTRVSLKAAYSNIVASNLVLWTAMDAGYFDREGIDLELTLIDGGQRSMAALIAGQVGVVQLGGSEVVSAAAAGADLVVVATLIPVWPFVLMASSDIKSAADLKGKKLAIATVGGSADIAARVLLPKLGLTPDTDVTFVATGSQANLTAALASGAAQAAMLLPPDTVALEAKGFTKLADLGQTPTSNTTVTVQRKFAESSRDAVQRYVNALVKGTARAKSDRAFAIGVLKKWLKLDDDKLAAAAYDHYAKIIPALPEPKAEQFADAIAQLGKTNEKVRTFDVSKILDPSFVRAAR